LKLSLDTLASVTRRLNVHTRLVWTLWRLIVSVHKYRHTANVLFHRQTYRWAAGVGNRAVIQAFVLSSLG